MRVVYFRPAIRLSKSAFASLTTAASWSRSASDRASALAATIIPLCPTGEPMAATFCQLWPGLPSAKQAVYSPLVGTIQLTSPTSVDPPSGGAGFSGSGSMTSCSGFSSFTPKASRSGSCSRRANSASAAVKGGGPTFFKLRSRSFDRGRFGMISWQSVSICTRTLVRDIFAPPSAMSVSQSKSRSTSSWASERT